MTAFSPPIAERPTDELVGIKNSSTDYWQQEAIDQAKEELLKRKISIGDERKILDNLHKAAKAEEIQQQLILENNATEGYKTWQMVLFFLAGPFVLLEVRNIYKFRRLKKDNYKLKIRQRLLLLIGGTIAWLIISALIKF